MTFAIFVTSLTGLALVIDALARGEGLTKLGQIVFWASVFGISYSIAGFFGFV